MQRRATCIAGAAALALILTGCGDDDGGEAADCSPADSAITVVAFDKLDFDADAYAAAPGCIDITYENDGSVAHTLLIKEQSSFKLSIGDTDEGTVDLEAGTYTLFCDVPGHEAAGMVADLTVD